MSSGQTARSRFDTTRPQRRKRKINDPIREMVNAAVQHHIVTGAKPALHVQPDSVLNVTGIAVSESETTIRVALRNGQERAFSVRVTEVMQLCPGGDGYSSDCSPEQR